MKRRTSSSRKRSPWPGSVPHGDVTHLRLFGTDASRLEGFYGDLFGWTFRALFGGTYLYFETSGRMAGNFQRPREGEPRAVTNFIEVESIDAILPRLTSLGGSVLVAKRPVGPIGFEVVFADPEGNVMGLFEHVREPPSRPRRGRRPRSRR